MVTILDEFKRTFCDFCLNCSGPQSHSSKIWLEPHIEMAQHFNFTSKIGQKDSGKKQAPEFKRPRLEPKLRPFWPVWLWASPFPLKASFPHLGGGSNTTTYLTRLWGWNTFSHVKSLTQKCFFFLLAHHSLNRDRQRVHSKGCAGSLTALFPLVPLCDELWENPHRGWLSSSELASRPKILPSH